MKMSYDGVTYVLCFGWFSDHYAAFTPIFDHCSQTKMQYLHTCRVSRTDTDVWLCRAEHAYTAHSEGSIVFLPVVHFSDVGYTLVSTSPRYLSLLHQLVHLTANTILTTLKKQKVKQKSQLQSVESGTNTLYTNYMYITRNNVYILTLEPPVPILFGFFYILLSAHCISAFKHVENKM